MTGPERVLWRAMRDRSLSGFKVRRQMPFGPYVLDFAVFENQLVIEVDGDTHASPEQAARDAARDDWLAERGWRVLRFSNRQVAENVEGVLLTIVAAVKVPHPGPLPAGEGAGSRSEGA